MRREHGERVGRDVERLHARRRAAPRPVGRAEGEWHQHQELDRQQQNRGHQEDRSRVVGVVALRPDGEELRDRGAAGEQQEGRPALGLQGQPLEGRDRDDRRRARRPRPGRRSRRRAGRAAAAAPARCCRARSRRAPSARTRAKRTPPLPISPIRVSSPRSVVLPLATAVFGAGQPRSRTVGRVAAAPSPFRG